MGKFLFKPSSDSNLALMQIFANVVEQWCKSSALCDPQKHTQIVRD